MSSSKGQTLPAGQNNTHQPTTGKHSPHSHITETNGQGHGVLGRREGESNRGMGNPDGSGGKKPAKGHK